MDNIGENLNKFPQIHEMFEKDPCYEQHVVEIKKIYEEHLLSVIVPALYEGFQSMYKKAYTIEKKFAEVVKSHPDKENPGVLAIFQTLLKEIPNLNNHKIRNETDRIKSATKSADIFDDLIKAVVKSNIILMTYNVDHKRKDLISTKYYENIRVNDFIHNCYVQSAIQFHRTPELFWHEFEPRVINDNKSKACKIIKESIHKAIRLMLPLKEILLEYLSQKYEQKDPLRFINPYSKFDPDNPYMKYYHDMIMRGGDKVYGSRKAQGQDNTGYMDMEQMMRRDLGDNYDGHSMLEDDHDNAVDTNAFDDGTNNNGTRSDMSGDFSMLISDQSNGSKASDEGSDHNDSHRSDREDVDQTNHKGGTDTRTDGTVHTEKTVHPDGFRMVDIGSIMQKKGQASSMFGEILPGVKKRANEIIEKKKKKSSSDVEITKVNDGKSAHITTEIDKAVSDKNTKKSDKHSHRSGSDTRSSGSDRNDKNKDTDKSERDSSKNSSDKKHRNDKMINDILKA